jgi:hypothetical protein
MYVTLFSLAGIGIVAWLLLILLPTWRVTRWLARTEIFPAYLAALYLAGVVPLLLRSGLGVVRDFGTAEGVTRLLADPDIALVAWIHILTFDQVVGLLIYRENMSRRYLPIPLQSVVLFLTLMFGPVGYLAYYLWRQAARSRQPAGKETERPAADTVDPPASPSVRSALGMLRAGWAEERTLFWLGVAGLVLGAAGAVVVAVHGPVIAPEGDVMKAATFDVAVGIYVLTIALFVPLAGFSPRIQWLWRGTQVASVVFAYAVENIQIARGFDPRFTRAGSAVDKLSGSVFFLVALGLIVAFAILAVALFRRRASVAKATVFLGIRYGCLATVPAFASGLWMSTVQGSRFGEAGNILPVHALGFHGLQALPLLALFLCWAHVPADLARRCVHATGIAWLGACAAVAWQTIVGRSVLEVTPATVLAAALLLAWLAVTAWAAYRWFSSNNDVLYSIQSPRVLPEVPPRRFGAVKLE